jgi:hypothetical protein
MCVQTLQLDEVARVPKKIIHAGLAPGMQALHHFANALAQ